MQAFQPKITLNCSGRLLDLSKPLVMGILNITPDSFYSGSRVSEIDSVLQKADAMLKSGAIILDIGGQSARPGSNQIGAEEEWKRLEEAVPELVKAFPQGFFSIDTYYGLVAENAMNKGFHLVNDVSAFEDDAQMFEFLKLYKPAYIMMHKKGKIEEMQMNPTYDHVVLEIIEYFKSRLSLLHKIGLNDVVLDPGFGFGKNLQHNLQILKNLNAFSIFQLPVLAGLSRKKMLRDIAGVTVENALNITTAANMLALQNGAKILRVHDVGAAMDAVKMYEAINSIS